MSFTGKVVLVTGSSSGIGASTAVEFAKNGASVVLVGRNVSKLSEVKAQCADTGDHLAIVADLRMADQVISVLDKTIAKYGRLDVLVNNAGAGKYGSIEEFSMEDFDWMLNLNLRSVVHLTKLAVPYLKKTKGNVVNVSSIAGLNAFPGCSTYCMSKAALDQFTKCTALDLGKYGIRVNSVNPAVIVTEFHKALGMPEDVYQNYLDSCEKTYPLQRAGKAVEVADAIMYLAKDTSAFITGILLPVSGGKHLC